MEDEVSQMNSPSLVASTLDIYCCTITESNIRERKLLQDTLPQSSSDGSDPHILSSIEGPDREVNYFKRAQWTPDGTSLLTSTADNYLRTFILPPTLLSSPSPVTLSPYTTHAYPSPLTTFTPHPSFDLSSPSSCLVLSAPSSLPVRLTNILSPIAVPVSTYPLISPTTEAYLTPASLLFTSSTAFLAGTDSLISVFDIHRNGEGAVSSLPTIPSKRHKMKGGGVGMRGIISALALQPTSVSEGTGEKGILAAGTWTRSVGLYDAAGVGGTISTFSIAHSADSVANISGSGVSQLLWSHCGRYLYIVERKSNGVLIFDVRVTGKLLGWLEGRQADTNQRMGVDVFEGEKGSEIWTGGTDGVVRVWEGVGMSEGAQDRTWEWKAHDDPVSSTLVHNSGTVVATTSGQRAPLGKKYSAENSEDSDDSGDSERDSIYEDDDDDRLESESRATSDTSSITSSSNSRIPDNSIKVWAL